MKILLLEDDRTDADLTKRCLVNTLPGCLVEVATTVQEAREMLLRDQQFDIGLLDMKLPDGSGLDLLMEIRQEGLNMAIVILTGSGDEEVAVSALKAGAEDYLVKRTGYLQQLPRIIEYALKSYKEELLKKAERINVLYIEHHSSDIDLTIRHLTKYAPYIRVEAVFSAEEALIKMGYHSGGILNYQVIMMDYRLPGLNSMELIKIIRHEINRDLPIIVVTGQGNEEIAIQAIKLGATEYLTKKDNYLFRLPSLILSVHEHYSLKKSETLKKKMVSNIGDVIVIIDRQGINRYKSPNVEKLFGWKPSELVGKSTWDNVHADDLASAMQFIASLMDESGKTGTIETRYRHKDGHYSWIEFTGSNLLDDPDIQGVLGNYHDITERKQAELDLIAAKEKAEENDHLKTAFLQNMSHEIRTPMNAIMGFSNLMAEAAGEEKNRYARFVLKGATQLMSIIDDVMSLSRMQSEKLPVHPVQFHPAVMVEEILAMLERMEMKKGVALKALVPEQHRNLVIESDAEKIRQILMNLLINALKYTFKGSVEFGFDIKNGQIEFFVRDTGMGVSEKEQKRIFDKFYRGEGALSKAIGGTGLGLSIAAELVTLLGGKIGVNSVPDQGSRFFFTLPVKIAEENPSEITIKQSIQTDWNNYEILIAEDDPDNYFYLEILLKDKVKRIDHATSGEEAIDFASNKSYNLILMDLKMPGMGGIEATRRIKQINPDVPVIAQTAFVQPEEKVRALQAGCDDYISKPISKVVLMKVIDKYGCNASSHL